MKLMLKVLACILALTLSCGVIIASAETDLIEPEINETEKVINFEEAVEPRGTPTSIITSGKVYNIVSAKSGKYLNVHYGNDTNGTNVYQWTADGSDEQQFKVVYSSSTASYKIYAMCSSNGTNRVLDIERNGAAVAAGQNVEIWTPVDPTAQNWTITNMGNGYFKISPKANTSLALTVCGTSNGTSGGRTSTSAGNVFISAYDTYITQLWTFEEVTTATPATPTGRLEQVSESGIKGYAWRSDIPNTPIFVKIYIENSEGEDVTGSPFTVEANIYRSDLSGYGNKYHGFQLNFNWSSVPEDVYTIYAFAITHTGGTVGLTASPKTYTVDHPPELTISNYIDQGYVLKFGGYDVMTYNSIVGAKLESIFGLEVTSGYTSHTSVADTCKLQCYDCLTIEELELPCLHIENNKPIHSNTQVLRDALGYGTNVEPKVLWTGHILEDNPASDSSEMRHSVVITPCHTFNEITGESYSAAEIRMNSLRTFMHEISHQLGAHDHYCSGISQFGDNCTNPYCDICHFELLQERVCLMTRLGDVENGNEATLYCTDCIDIITDHIADHHD